jgi:tRNA threonylcarbamoyladenosine biosynthesis protein TsaE
MPPNPSATFELPLPDEASTLALGAALACAVQLGAHIFLSGELGAGKTTLVRGLLRELGFEGRVKSPTYALVESYVVSKLHLYHFDFYRFTDPEEWEAAGFRDLFDNTNICLVEWPEKALSLLPAADLSIHLSHAGLARQAQISSRSPQGQQMLNTISHRLHMPRD